MQIKKLLTTQNYKTVKGEKYGYETSILYMTPAYSIVDGVDLCPFRSAGCTATCLNTAGRGEMHSVQRGRARKRRQFLMHRDDFVTQLAREIPTACKHAAGKSRRSAVRLNGTTDVAWHKIAPELFSENPKTIFYDYTKSYQRMLEKRPDNYDLTFSRSETNEDECLQLLRLGRRVAVVFATKRGAPLPASWHGWPVVDGDVHDLRFLDGGSVVVGLRAKGRARHALPGFVVPVREDVLVA